MDKITLREKFFYFFFDKKGWIPLMVLALFFFLLKAAPTVMTILILSFFIAYAIEPLVNFFSSKVKLPRAIMTAFVLFLVMMVRIPHQEASQRFGIAEGKFTVPAEFDAWDDEITELFGDTI